MGKENDIKFTTVSFKLEFTVYTYDGEEDGETVYIPFDCGESIELAMKAYLEKKWTDLFDGNNVIDVRNIAHVYFDGIRLSAEDDNGNKLWAGAHGRTYATVRFNLDWLAEDNAKKIRQIKEIIN